MKRYIKKISLVAVVALPMVFSACDKNTNSVNIFTIEDDKALGNQVEQEILGNPSQYPLLDEGTYATSYSHVNRIVNTILAAPSIAHRGDFDWKVRIVRDDATLNAFAAPGGKIFVYTGIIKFLEAEDEFAGVMGHEIAHADRRHVTDAMTKAYGLQLLLDVVLGKNQGALTQMASGLVNLKFGRDHETDADEHGVIYLSESSENYDPTGVGKFFQKLINLGQGGQGPEFLSTHPNPENRVENINKKAQEIGETTGQTYTDRYSQFKASLP